MTSSAVFTRLVAVCALLPAVALILAGCGTPESSSAATHASAAVIESVSIEAALAPTVTYEGARASAPAAASLTPPYDGPTVTLYHDPSGLRLTLPADRPFMKGTYDDGYASGRSTSSFGGDREVWNAVQISYGDHASVLLYALPAEEYVDLAQMERVSREVAAMFMGELEILSSREDATLGGHPALEMELRMDAHGMVSRASHLLVHHGGYRYGHSYMMVGQAASDAEMQDLVRQAQAEISVEIPR